VSGAPQQGLSIATILLSFAFYLSLAVGGIGLGEELSFARLATSGPLLIAAAFLLSLPKKLSLQGIFAVYLVLLYCIIQLMRAEDLTLALRKLDGFIVGGMLVYLFGSLGVQRGENRFYRSFILVALLTLLLTISYKFVFGFWDRQVRFLLNGPIVFGWMMLISSLVSLHVAQGHRKFLFLLFSAIFVTALLWTGSKGPIIGWIAGVSCIFYSQGRLTKFPIFVVTVIFLIVFLYEYNLIPERFQVFERLLAGNLLTSDFGSIGIRQLMIFDAWQLFEDHLVFGLGLGNWGSKSNLSIYFGEGIVYPHNIFAELLSEHGLVGFIILLTVFVIAFQRSSDLGRAIFAAMFISLLFTGDMGYWHFLVALPLSMSSSSDEEVGP